MVSGVALPAPFHSFLKLLGGAASPCALIALGLFLAGTPAGEARRRASTATILVALKLVVQPALTWLIATPLLHLPTQTAHIAVLLSALPTGTGPFMLAEFYNREASLTGRVVLASTILSIVTISAYLAISGH
jgi:predicted permease